MNRQEIKKEIGDLIKLTREYICAQQGDFSVSKLKKTDKKLSLKDLKDKYANCQRCSLGRGRKHLVFGEGNSRAKLVFVGEAPGREEDLQGYPFVGRAGKLLDKILAAIGLQRSDIYITNILKCRPPNNRDPEPQEISTCQQILWEQLEVMKPKLICALGRFAAQTLLNSQERIGRLRGQWFDLRGIKLLVTYHPAYLLRNPGDKRLVWDDVKKLKKEYDKIES